MKNELMIKTHEIDWLKIIELALRKQDWGKNYVLYSIGTTSVNCVMSSFDFERNEATFRITVLYKNLRATWYNTKSVRYALSNFSIDNFKLYLNRAMTSLLQDIVYHETEIIAKEKYDKQKRYSWTIKRIDYENTGYLSEWETVNAMLSSDVKNDLLDSLSNSVQTILNKPYEDSVKLYIERWPIKIQGFIEILEDLKSDEE